MSNQFSGSLVHSGEGDEVKVISGNGENVKSNGVPAGKVGMGTVLGELVRGESCDGIGERKGAVVLEDDGRVYPGRRDGLLLLADVALDGQDVVNFKTSDIFGGDKLECASSSSLTSDENLKQKMKEPLACNFCGRCFKNLSILHRHKIFHRPDRPFKCEHEKCDKAYKSKYHLNRHLSSHSGERNHLCKCCGKTYLAKKNLKEHVLRHHGTGVALTVINCLYDNSAMVPSAMASSTLLCKIEPLTWRCEQCKKIFVYQDEFTTHIRSFHEKKRKNPKTSIPSKVKEQFKLNQGN